MLVALLVALATPAAADGIPEPSMVIYGVVSNLSAGGSRVSFGALTWIFHPADGSPEIILTGVLTNINDQFSYVLRVPCETQIPGVPLSAGALKLTTFSSRYDLSRVTIQGVAATFVDPSLATLNLAPTDRGRIGRIDLRVSLNTGSQDQKGQWGSDTGSPEHGFPKRNRFVARRLPRIQ